MTDQETVTDETDSDTTIAPKNYDITSYGADYDVEGCVKRLNRGDIFIPPFQRDYVWNIKDASRFIESLLFGLPVPGVFLAKEPGTNKLLVIDGQQRLKTLKYYFDGIFNPNKEEKTHRVFKLYGVQEKYEGKTYSDLDESDRVNLNDTIIHATIIKQESPDGDDTSIYHVFERLNSGGRKLTAQEIRSALYHGKLIDLINELNSYADWREIFGKPHKRLKDVELILRFLAIHISGELYKKPMNEFLNRFTANHKNATDALLLDFEVLFKNTISLIFESIGKGAFKLERGINAAVFDSVMSGVATRIHKGPINDSDSFASCYKKLLENDSFIKAVSQSTSDDTNVSLRIKIAQEAFEKAK
ncbi:MAG: DUF262 domain-containing protein [Campylobacterota bacterium]|nr:DUF262 domain-containing protein [Campylobacterota bacterium]